MPGFENFIDGAGAIGWYGNPTYFITDKPVRESEVKNPPMGEDEKLSLLNSLQPPRMEGPNSVTALMALATEEGRSAAAGEGTSPFIPIMIAGGMYGWSGNGFQYIAPTFGNYNTYRLMADHPTINLGLSMFRDPVIQSSIRIEKGDSDVPDSWIKLVEKQVKPQIQMVLAASMDCLKFGWQPFEKVWSLKDGDLWCALRPIIQDYSQIWVSAIGGNFAGVSYRGEENLLSPNKCVVISNDPHLGPYGKSALDRTYEPFIAWQRTRVDQRKLRDKLAGILPILYYPPGKQIMPDGTEIDNSVIAKRILEHIGKGYAATLPSAQFAPGDIVREPRLATTSLWRLDFYDAGNLAPAQLGNIAELRYNDTLFFRALSLPERAGQAGEHGTNAESETQSEGSVLSKENLASSVASQLTSGNQFFGVKGWIDDILLYNVGPQAVGRVQMKFAPLADYKLRYKSDLLKAALTQPTPAAAAFMQTIDFEKTLADFGYDLSEAGFDVNAFQADTAALHAAKQPQNPGKGGPVDPAALPNGNSVNGNGKSNGKGRPAWVRDFVKRGQ